MKLTPLSHQRNYSFSFFSELVVADTFAQLVVDGGIVLGTQELVQQFSMTGIVHVASQEVDISLVQHPVSHLLGHIAIHAGKREDVHLELHLMLLQVMIESAMMTCVVHISLGVSQYQIVTVRKESLHHLVEDRDGMREGILDQQVFAMQGADNATWVSKLARLHHLQERIVHAILETEVLALNRDTLLRRILFQVVEQRLDNLGRIHEAWRGMVGRKDHLLDTERLHGTEHRQGVVHRTGTIIDTRYEVTMQLSLIGQR